MTLATTSLAMLHSTASRALAALLAFLALASVASAAIPFEPLDPAAIERAVRAANDTAGVTDMVLTRYESLGGRPIPDTSVLYALYLLYSPSRNLQSHVIVAKQDSVTFVIHRMFQRPHPAGAAPPSVLDTTQLDLHLPRFVAAVTADPAYIAYRAKTPGSPLRVALRLAEDPLDYPVPAGIAATDPVWIAYNSPVGDSSYICMYSPRTGTVACSTYRSLDDVSTFRRSTRSDADFSVTADGHWGGDGSYTFPRGSGVTYVAGAGLWFGARKRVGDLLVPRVFLTYDPQSGSSWATVGDALIPRSELPRTISQTSARHDTLTGAPIGTELYPWPLWVASRHTNPSFMHPGDYAPRIADRAAGGTYAKSAFVAGITEQFTTRFHDQVFSRYELNGEARGFPLGLQFRQDVFAQPGGMPGTLFVRYAIVNISSDTLFDAVVAPICDWDIGNARDDFGGFHTSRPELRSLKMWSAGGATAPSALMTLLEAPMTNASGQIDNSRRSEYRSKGRVAAANIWYLGPDPITSAARYEVLTNGEFDTVVAMNDQRGIIASATFTMLPGDTAYVGVGFTTYANVAIVDTLAALMIDHYYTQRPAGVEAESSATLAHTIAPNPATDRATLHLGAPAQSGATMRIVDALGRTVRAMAIEVGSTDVAIDLRELPAGQYIVGVGARGIESAASVLIVR
jgi:hypothetical protein